MTAPVSAAAETGAAGYAFRLQKTPDRYSSKHKPIPQAPDGLDIFGLAGIIFDFLPQPVDIDHDGVLVNDGLAPHHFIEHIFGEDAVDVIDEQLHQGIFLGGQRNLLAVFVQPQGLGIVAEGPGGDDVFPGGGAPPAPADQGLDLCPQHYGVEGLGYIVVRADVQAVQGIVVLLPARFLPLAAVLGFRDSQMIAILIMVGAPTTVSCFVMAKNMNADSVLTPNVVLLSTPLSALSITFWLYLMRGLGWI